MTNLICRRVVVAGSAAAAAGLAALKNEAQAQTQTKPTGVSPAELAKHEKFMRLAIAQANRNPGRPFGSVLVDDRTGVVVGEGVVDLAANPMFHSEVMAMNAYIAKHGNKGWENLTMYGTGEACPMCMSAMVWAGIPRMVYGSDTPFVRQYVADINIRAKTVADAGQQIYSNKLLLGGVLSNETDKLFEARGKIGEKK
ncbi:MAG: nucleoside deaminase [Reyranella sp.]|uniref:deaminase n=1 Tax=Reyranella sp. TaxID=1929291 RepID=UPI001211FBB7|nr:nucleoside deaminase [Reyranella sp.]TAJ38629.1 MAG: nucleoside deaminase [Reyranella sp.]